MSQNKNKKIRNKIGEEQVVDRVDIGSHALVISFCTTKTLVATTQNGLNGWPKICVLCHATDPPIMAINLALARAKHASPMNLGRSHDGAFHEERSKPASGQDQHVLPPLDHKEGGAATTPCLLQWALALAESVTHGLRA